MSRGPKPKPTEILKLTGAFEKNPQRYNGSEPEAPKGRPEMPDWLDDVAQEKWRQTCSELEALGILSPVFADEIAAYADTFSDYMRALEISRKVGVVRITKGEDGAEIKRNPAMTEKHKLRDALAKARAELGLTPSAKTRLSVNDKPNTLPSRQRKKRG